MSVLYTPVPPVEALGPVSWMTLLPLPSETMRFPIPRLSTLSGVGEPLSFSHQPLQLLSRERPLAPDVPSRRVGSDCNVRLWTEPKGPLGHCVLLAVRGST